MRQVIRALRVTVFFLISLFVLPAAQSQVGDFPNRTIKIVVPFPPGGVVDASTRVLAEMLSQSMPERVIVENKPGGSGVVGAMAVKGAPADGYTILIASSSMLSVNPITVKNLPYDPAKDFKPLSGFGRFVSVLVVSADSKVRTIPELVALAKANPGKPLNAGTYSAAYYLPLEWFSGLAGVKFTNVSYKGAPPMITDVLGHQLDFAYMSLSDAAPLIKSGKIRALATSGEKRIPDFPEMPTVAESGYPDFVTYVWNAICVRADTPKEISDKLSIAIDRALKSEAFKAYAKNAQLELMPLGPQAMSKFHTDELARFGSIAKSVGYKPE